jgi:hypothetical protein
MDLHWAPPSVLVTDLRKAAAARALRREDLPGAVSLSVSRHQLLH